MGKGLATYAWGPEFHPQHPSKQSGEWLELVISGLEMFPDLAATTVLHAS